MIGKVILHYKIIEKIGAGGMGLVFKAEDTRLKRQVAIKFLPPQVATIEEERRRFKIEARAAAALNHPNIAIIYAIEELDDQLFIVMEYIEGVELLTRIQAGPVTIDEALDYAAQIATGIRAAHQKGILHRDIKSSNIMITASGKIKIMDFGLAKIGGNARLTKTGTTMGTIAYMSPEQSRGDKTDQRSDIWAFGVVLYEMLTGELPFKGDNEQAVIYSILFEEPVPAIEIRPEIPVELDRLVRAALVKDLNQRYSRIEDVLVDLGSLTGGTVDISTERRFAKRAGVGNGRQPGLAVLPFTSLKHDPQSDFLGFALADQIISALTYFKNILVKPSSAVRKYQDQTVDAITAGKDLQVGYILAGTYLKEGDAVRLNVELVDTYSNEMLWREAIEVAFENAFKLQDIVSEKVIQGLEIQFSLDERGRKRADTPKDPLAYEYYLRGVAYPHTNEGDQLAVSILRKAIELDENYAPAHAELGFRLYKYGTFALQGVESYKDAEKSYRKALSLKPENFHALRGLANLYTDIGKTDLALEYSLRMLKINPTHPMAHFSLSYLCRFTGLLEESIRETEETFKLEPRNPIFRSAGLTYFYVGDYDKAIEILEYDKGSVFEISWVGYALFLVGKKDEALERFDRAISLETEGHFGYHFGAIKEAELGNNEAGISLVHKWEATDPYDSEVWYSIANTYALLGDKEGCLRALERAIEGGFFNHPYMVKDPFLDVLRDDPEMGRLLDLAKSKHEAFKERYYQERQMI